MRIALKKVMQLRPSCEYNLLCLFLFGDSHLFFRLHCCVTHFYGIVSIGIGFNFKHRNYNINPGHCWLSNVSSQKNRDRFFRFFALRLTGAVYTISIVNSKNYFFRSIIFRWVAKRIIFYLPVQLLLLPGNM